MPLENNKNKLKPKKSLGQNFLFDQNIIEKLVKSINLKKSDIILEIGPGTGFLTKKLAPLAKKIYAVEIDAELLTNLKQSLSDFTNIIYFEKDFLKFDLDQLPEKKIRVIANIPYYISTKIIKKFINYPKKFTSLIFLVQKEFAQKITALPGTENYTSLTVYTNYYFQTKKLFEVKKECFFPKPQVDSCFLELVPINQKYKINEEKFFALVRSAFWARRKTLVNCLEKSPYLKLNPDFKKIDFFQKNPDIRGEKLNLEDFFELYKQIISFKSCSGETINV